jgi:hypothetical protein
MSTDYANATIANAAALAGTFPSGTPAVQPPIASNSLTAANNESWNGHIGLRETKVVTAAQMVGATADGNYPASPGTLGRDEDGNLMTWATCVLGTTAGTTGTLTGSAFVAGAGAAVAQGDIPANGYGWVKN